MRLAIGDVPSYPARSNERFGTDVRHGWRGDELDRFENRITDVLEQPLTSSENDRNDVQVELVKHSGREVLPHRACATRDRDLLIAGGLPCLL